METYRGGGLERRESYNTESFPLRGVWKNSATFVIRDKIQKKLCHLRNKILLES